MSWINHNTSKHVEEFHRRQEMIRSLRMDDKDPYETQYQQDHGGPRFNYGKDPVVPAETFLTSYTQDFVYGQPSHPRSRKSQSVRATTSAQRSKLDSGSTAYGSPSRSVRFPDNEDVSPSGTGGSLPPVSSLLTPPTRSLSSTKISNSMDHPFSYTNSAVLHSSSGTYSKSISQLPPIRQRVRTGGMRKGATDHLVSEGWTGRMPFDGLNHKGHRGAKTASHVDFSTCDGDLDWSQPTKPYSKHAGWNSSTHVVQGY